MWGVSVPLQAQDVFDWGSISHAVLKRRPHLCPAAVGRMTLSEITFLLAGPDAEDETPTDAELAARRRRWLSLTAAQQLEEAIADAAAR